MKRYVLFIFVLSLTLCANAGQRIDAYFAKMPQTVLPLLDKTARLDLLDLYNSHLTPKVENVYGGQSALLSKTDDYIQIRCTDASSWQMKLLPVAHYTLIVCISTVRGLNTYSRLTYYRGSDWHQVKRDLPQPAFNLFVKSAGETLPTRLQSSLDVLRNCPIQLTLSEREPILTCALSLAVLPLEAQKNLTPLLQSVRYKWTSGKWVLLPNR